METIIIDKAYPECCALDVEQHVANSLGQPVKLPPTLEDKLSEDWANSCEDDLLALFELITGVPYEQKHRDNTYNQENDLSAFLVWTVYAPVDSPDWIWQRDVFVVIEIGAGGDPRYSAYGPARIYHLADDTIGDSGFLEFTLGWWAEPIDAMKYDDATLDRFNDRITVGYSSHPYYELESLLYKAPIWCERIGAYLGRFKDSPFPVKLRPIEPCYG
jgi:hypothetical protein